MDTTDSSKQNIVGCLIRGEPNCSSDRRSVHSPFKGDLASVAAYADSKIANLALEAAVDGAQKMRNMPPVERSQILERAAAALDDKGEALAQLLTRETGKVLRDTRIEMARAVEVVRLSGHEAVRLEGRHISLDATPSPKKCLAIAVPMPLGVILGIIPFNAPVNLACHKIAPALAAGNSIIIKAAPQCPATLNALAQIFLDAGAPPEALSMIHADIDISTQLVDDPRVDFLSFTGSHTAGLQIKKRAGTRGCLLELGGIGPVILHEDGNVIAAAKQCAAAGFRLAGQSCASVQNLFVHSSRYNAFCEAFLLEVFQLKMGDPSDPLVDLGPVIDDRAAERIITAIESAVAQGATILIGGNHQDRMVEATVVADVTPEMSIVKDEIFGPVVVLRKFDDLSEPIEWINGTRQGINCGLFTESHQVAMRAFTEISTAAVIVNGTCTFRPGQFPYGGSGASGYGRESPRDSVRAMTQERVLVFN